VNFDSANRTLPYPGLSAAILTISTAATSNSKSGSWISSDVSRPAYPGGNTRLFSSLDVAGCEKWTKNVIFLSENPSYDPIMLSEGQVSILGIAVGVVKNG